MPKAEKRPRGRPTLHTAELAAEIAQRIADGEKLTEICQDAHMPAKSTVLGWVIDQRGAFADQYARAMQIRALEGAAELLAIADDTSNDTFEDEEGRRRPNSEWMQRSKLRVDTRKWILSKLLPRTFGDKLAIGGDGDAPPLQISNTERETRLREILGRIEDRVRKEKRAPAKRRRADRAGDP